MNIGVRVKLPEFISSHFRKCGETTGDDGKVWEEWELWFESGLKRASLVIECGLTGEIESGVTAPAVRNASGGWGGFGD